jgi:hypothetical protein
MHQSHLGTAAAITVLEWPTMRRTPSSPPLLNALRDSRFVFGCRVRSSRSPVSGVFLLDALVQHGAGQPIAACRNCRPHTLIHRCVRSWGGRHAAGIASGILTRRTADFLAIQGHRGIVAAVAAGQQD